MGCVIEELHWAPTYSFQSVPVFIARKPGYIQVSTKPDGYHMGCLVKETGDRALFENIRANFNVISERRV